MHVHTPAVYTESHCQKSIRISTKRTHPVSQAPSHAPCPGQSLLDHEQERCAPALWGWGSNTKNGISSYPYYMYPTPTAHWKASPISYQQQRIPQGKLFQAGIPSGKKGGGGGSKEFPPVPMSEVTWLPRNKGTFRPSVSKSGSGKGCAQCIPCNKSWPRKGPNPPDRGIMMAPRSPSFSRTEDTNSWAICQEKRHHQVPCIIFPDTSAEVNAWRAVATTTSSPPAIHLHGQGIEQCRTAYPGRRQWLG